MKKLFLLLAFVSIAAFAEPSFDQVESLIGKQQYSAAEQGLEQIIKNHPNSAKAYYAMAQAQAGLGNQEKARYALDKATGLDPDLKFATAENIQSLREAITPQTKKIEVVKEKSHWFRNLLILIGLIFAGYIIWRYIRNNNGDSSPFSDGGQVPPKPPAPAPRPSSPAYSPSSSATTYNPPTSGTPTVINNHYGSSNDGLVTGMVLGSMLSNNHSHDTVYIDRTVQAPSRDSSWDSDSSSKSSSWDNSSSSSSSSSSSDSSWDSGSSSSDSSWD